MAEYPLEYKGRVVSNAVRRDWKAYYNDRSVTAAEAVKVIKSGNRVTIGTGAGEPPCLVDAMVARADELEGVELVNLLCFYGAKYCRPELAKSFRYNSLFLGAPGRQEAKAGRVDYTCCFFHEMPLLFKNDLMPTDVALITVTPPDKLGYVCMGLCIDTTKAEAIYAKKVIASVNSNMPRIAGDTYLHVTDIDYFVQTDEPLLALKLPQIGPVESAIGMNVASLIKDGDCLQPGIGGMPDAALEFCAEKNDLGIHAEMITDATMKLVETGAVTGNRKTFKPRKLVSSCAMGTEPFYKWLNDNTFLEFYPIDFTNDPYNIASNDNVVSINAAIAVDLQGQVAADTLGARQFSGVGGQVDFVRGANRSKGGRSIIAMKSTAVNGTLSRVVPSLERGQAVTTSRFDVAYIVTEYGIAFLKGKNIRQRAEALIAVAAPQFRDQLREEFRVLYGYV